MSDGTDETRRGRKSPGAYRTISEVADELQVPQHVLRFWETKFPQIRPLKRGGGRRYYRPEDILLLRRIASLLYVQGYTIKGVQRLLREGGPDGEFAPAAADEAEADDMAEVPPAPPPAPQLALPGMPDQPPVAPKPVVRVRAESAAQRAAAAAASPAPAPVAGSHPPSDAALDAARAENARLRALLVEAAAELRAVRDALAEALPPP